MQVTENFYNVLWWSKNACQYRFGSPCPLARPRVPTRHHHIATVTKDFAQYRMYHPFTSRTTSARVIIDFQSASKCFCADALVPAAWGCRTSTGTHSYSTTTHCKIFLSLASPFLLCCNASIFFRILFSSLCCAVTGFVAGNIRGVLFDTFCFWACNSPYFILIFLLPQI